MCVCVCICVYIYTHKHTHNEYFLLVCGLSYHFLNGAFQREVLSFDEDQHNDFFSFIISAFWTCLKKSLPTLRLQRFLYSVFFLEVLASMFRSVIHFMLIFVHGVRCRDPGLFFSCVGIFILAIIVEKLPFLHWVTLEPLFKKIN